MYLRVIGSICILFSASCAGWSYGERYRKRIDALREWCRILRMAEGEIRYRKVPLGDIFSQISLRASGTFAEWLSGLSDALCGYSGKTFRELWEESVTIHFAESAFVREDIRMIKELGDGFGYLDIRMQETMIHQAVCQAEERIAVLEQSLAEKQKISRMLGISIGIFCVILFM